MPAQPLASTRLEHYILHSLQNHSRTGDHLDHRSIREVANDLYRGDDYAGVRAALQALMDQGDVQRTAGRRGTGYRVDNPCRCREGVELPPTPSIRSIIEEVTGKLSINPEMSRKASTSPLLLITGNTSIETGRETSTSPLLLITGSCKTNLPEGKFAVNNSETHPEFYKTPDQSAKSCPQGAKSQEILLPLYDQLRNCVDHTDPSLSLITRGVVPTEPEKREIFGQPSDPQTQVKEQVREGIEPPAQPPRAFKRNHKRLRKAQLFVEGHQTFPPSLSLSSSTLLVDDAEGEWRSLSAQIPGKIGVSREVSSVPGKRKSRRPPPGADTALGLALYFEQLVEDKGQLWPTNRGALASAFAAWRRKGWTAEQIRAMIDAFARRDALIKTSGRAAWRVFLARAEEFRREVEYVSAPVRNDPSVRWV